ncbi:hypothetical protein [Aliirhizobium smilacinae]|nr:hypothetical protein [Rhizobium smilacinae]
MAALLTALAILTFPIRVIWFLALAACLVVVAPVFLMLACFVGFWIVLAISYVFLPSDWTLTLWQSASDLYDQSAWFKAATITSWTLLCLPILAVWPGRPPTKSQRDLDDEAYTAALFTRQQDECRAKFKKSFGHLD